MSKIKIISGWSNPGGSTTSFINLCNLFNENGLDCTFYGPHEWHLDKCKSGRFPEAQPLDPEDTVIMHFFRVKERPPVKRFMLSCHETNLFPLKSMDFSFYDTIHFVSNFQKDWHSINHPSIVIPPIVQKIDWENPKNNTAGVIGSIDSHKQTHLSITKAIDEGWEKVLLFGVPSDPEYITDFINPWIESGQVIMMDHEDSREAMYSKICMVYHSSKRETYGLVEAECKLAGIPFIGPSNDQDILDEEDILKQWKTVLQ